MKLLLFIFLLFLSSQNPTSAQCPESQKASLLTLFPSPQSLSWTPTTDCCSWNGVKCDPATGHVTSLDLTNRSISGPLNSTAFISLPSLQSLNLSLNLFNSSIPDGVFDLPNLTSLNLSNSGFYGQVPGEISQLKRLVSLDLSTSSISGFFPLFPVSLLGPDLGFLAGNLSGLREVYLYGVVVSSPVPESLVGLVDLRILRLGSCNLTGGFPGEMFKLQNLEILDVSNNPLLTGTLPEFPLNSSLRILTLSGSNFSGGLLDSIGNLGLLERLELAKCNLSGGIPPAVFGISSLVHLDISSNSFSGEIQSLGNLTQLVHLDLSGNHLSGSIPLLDKFTRIIHLDLSSNSFSGQIPWMGSLKSAVEISFSNNNFSGAIDSSFGDGLLNLTNLDLHNNTLSGKIPTSLFSLPSLKLLQLSHNQFDAQLDDFHSNSSSLNTLDLSYNRLQGVIPSSVFELMGLNVLTLASNNLSGAIDLAMIQNLKNLSSIDLSDNLLSINDGSTSISSFPHVGTLKLRSCNLTRFPDFLRNQSRLFALDLSNNKIGGEIPEWIWEIGNWSLNYLNISYNQLTGQVPPINVSLSKLTILDLHSNKLQGSIPFPPTSAIIVDYSHNNFTSVIPPNISTVSFIIFFSLSSNKISGEIPPSICNASFLQILDLSNNSLSGLIPECLGKMGSSLQVLNLGKNNLTGTIPQMFVDECGLKTLNLNGNQLEGSMPRSLANCLQLEVVNLGNNRISDSFPSWLGSLLQLRVLILRSNKLYGSIGEQEDVQDFQQLQIIDLSSNGLTGNLPLNRLERLKGMTADMDEEQSKLRHQTLKFGFLELNPLYYQETITVTIKGLEMEFRKILTVFTSMDLSNNNFQGEIPKEIGNLKSLYMLNMSHNKFIGPIPLTFGNLLQLESLDLSVNQLSGEIPEELTALTFLSFLNLSENNFVGHIPGGFQFNTFSNDSFKDNSGLCGLPLTKPCEATPESQSVNLQSRNTFNWQIIWTGLGFGAGVGMIFGPLVFWRKGRRWYNKHVDKMFFTVMPECTWSLIDCDGGKIEAEEKIEQELMEFASDMEMKEEEQCRQRFCVFCTQIDVSWRRAIHTECSCLDPSPLYSSQGSQIAEKTIDY
eukprot:TRINITY_DN5237_c0_g4_i1.p1 TRINITY_DN5237_c0_g4~~TRINITY_DN5237_c0_g4_i1.p1  ORF type:complete len:1135 (+),score=178.94 TRINITY_DN5237_c0_g4_i1:74-3406(+)